MIAVEFPIKSINPSKTSSTIKTIVINNNWDNVGDLWIKYEYFVVEESLYTRVQWNLSKADIFGTIIVVRFRQVSTLDRLCLWDFNQ